MKRLDRAGAYETLITRDDGVVYLLRGVGDRLAIPHDLAHFVVESTLGIDDGFWGTVAGGAVFATMHYRSGRRAPKASVRSRQRLAANVHGLGRSEVLVQALAGDAGIRRAGSSLTAVQSSAVADAYRDAVARWASTDVGAAMELRWE